jgi:hypothetical protein
MPPSVLHSDDRADVTSALASQPKFTDPQVKALYNWVLRLVTALFNYVSYFIGDNSDRTDSLQERVLDLEEKFQELQSSAAVPSTTVPPTTPHPNPQQPLHQSRRPRCKRCHALGHDTNDCRSKDPVAVKKRISNNQKARKLNTKDPPLLGGPGVSIVPTSSAQFGTFGPTDRWGYPLQYNHSSQSFEAFTALAVDAKELRRRKVQSTRDKRLRRGATTTTSA